MEDSEPPDPIERPSIIVLSDIPVYIKKLEQLDSYAFDVGFKQDYTYENYSEKIKDCSSLIEVLQKEIRYVNRILVLESRSLPPTNGKIPKIQMTKLSKLAKSLMTKKIDLESKVPLNI